MTTTTPTSTTPSSDRRSATRAKLLDAALDVFAEKGLHGASVDDLAAAAGFTKGALYSNFATKEELFGAVIDEQGHRMIAAVREVMTSHAHEIDDHPALAPQDQADPVLAEVLTRINGIGHRWYLLESEFQLYGLRSPEGRDLYAAHCAHFRGELGGLLEELLSRKGRRLTVPPEQLAEIVIVVYMNQLAQQLLDIVPAGAGGLLDVVLPGPVRVVQRARRLRPDLLRPAPLVEGAQRNRQNGWPSGSSMTRTSSCGCWSAGVAPHSRAQAAAASRSSTHRSRCWVATGRPGSAGHTGRCHCSSCSKFSVSRSVRTCAQPGSSAATSAPSRRA